MKNIALALAVLILSASFARAQDSTIDVPGVHISTGDDGVVVSAPGVSINAITQPSSLHNRTVDIPSDRGVQRLPNIPPNQSASYVNAQMPGMDFSNKNLLRADFTNAVLSGSGFRGSLLTGADFTNAHLDGVDFSGAQLSHAQFVNADLSHANLTNADLSGADLTNATLSGTIVTGARFDGADLTNVDMSRVIRTAAPAVVFVQPAPQRTAVVDAQAITTALKAPDKKIDLTINFDFNSDKLTSDGTRQVAQVATSLKDPSLVASRFMIEGHTDNVGSESYNKDLSYRRASRVMRTLSEQYNIEPARLSSQGFGKSKPVASNDTDLGRAQNRRVTIVNLGN